MRRPSKALLVLITGTGTEVGKTWVAARLATVLRARGRRVAARKPAQSFTPGAGATDAEVLAAATGERPEDVCPPHRWYEVAMAPPMAADLLGRPRFTITELAAELRAPHDADVVVVEGVGGVRSPLAHDGDTVTLAQALAPDSVVLVADAGLGVINAVLLSTAALDGWPVRVVLNRFQADDALHEANRRWLEQAGVAAVRDVDDLADQLPLG